MARKRKYKTKKLQKLLEEGIPVEKQRPWSDLPTDLLKLIETNLTLEDSIRFSYVCKNWNSLDRSHRVINQTPILLFHPINDDAICEFFDPSQRKSYFHQVPELLNAVIYSSKDDWLLVSNNILGIYLLNPFTNSKIDLPYFDPEQFQELEVTLSCAPTSPAFMVFAIRDTYPDTLPGVTINIWHFGDSQWTTINHFYQDELLQFAVYGLTPFFCNGLFYCLNTHNFNMIGVFDPKEYTWSILPVPPPMPIRFTDLNYMWRAVFMAEFKGELLFVHMLYPRNPNIFKLDLYENRWVEIRSLEGETLFVSEACSLLESEIPRISRNNVYLPRIHRYGNRCYSYSLEDSRYYPIRYWPNWTRFEDFDVVWIRSPKMTQPLIEEHD
ncbi:F-box/kelch-repeat protein At1g57790-like [Telopea speciosissima]|uniref:F-box/kelch-repeat protein At1g57790-like n=1 Tax=Telopea speciosissima TaxID=54955 RepID=UPI001CC5C8D1|nr:F-box/kelch-repeat protein At1g57790-like [Telopea speciosissima]